MTAPRAPGSPSTLQTVAVLLLPLWIILITFINALWRGEVTL